MDGIKQIIMAMLIVMLLILTITTLISTIFIAPLATLAVSLLLLLSGTMTLFVFIGIDTMAEPYTTIEELEEEDGYKFLIDEEIQDYLDQYFEEDGEK